MGPQPLGPQLAGPMSEAEIGGWCHLAYANAQEASLDVQFAGGRGADVFVERVLPGGAAQRAGVMPGFRLVALNSDRQEFRAFAGFELLTLLQQSQGNYAVAMDLVDPKPSSHGVPSLGDAVARRPLRVPLLT